MEIEIKQYLLPRVLFYWNLSGLVYLERQKFHDNVLGLSVGSKTIVLEIPPPMPPPVPTNFVVFPSGCGDSVAEF